MRRVLVVDDEENLRLVARTFLKREGYEVEVAGNGGLNDQGNPLDTIGLALIAFDLKVSGNGSFATTVSPL